MFCGPFGKESKTDRCSKLNCEFPQSRRRIVYRISDWLSSTSTKTSGERTRIHRRYSTIFPGRYLTIDELGMSEWRQCAKFPVSSCPKLPEHFVSCVSPGLCLTAARTTRTTTEQLSTRIWSFGDRSSPWSRKRPG